MHGYIATTPGFKQGELLTVLSSQQGGTSISVFAVPPLKGQPKVRENGILA